MQVVTCLSTEPDIELQSAIGITGQDSMAVLLGTRTEKKVWIVTYQGQISPFQEEDFFPILLHNDLLLGTSTNKVVMVTFVSNKKCQFLLVFSCFQV